MYHWILPAFTAFVLWGLWVFLPKISIQYISPKSVLIYEAIGVIIVAVVVYNFPGFKLEWDARGASLALLNGIIGFAGALFYLMAVQKGPVLLIATLTALYPLITIALAFLFLNEAVSLKQGIGVVLAIIAMILFAS